MRLVLRLSLSSGVVLNTTRISSALVSECTLCNSKQLLRNPKRARRPMIGVVVLPLLGLVAPTLTLVTQPFRASPHHGSAAVMQETLDAAPSAPGVAEDSVFITDASVKIWKEFQRDGPADAAENLREIAAIASRIATQGADGLTYALAHGLRTGYFAVNAALGTLAFELNDRLRGDG